MKGTVKDYVTAISWMLDIEGIDVTSDANHRMLNEGKITLEAFQAAARLIADKLLGDVRTTKESWQKEKSRREKRAQELGPELDAAIEAVDRIKFEALYSRACNCMNQKTRSTYYKRFLQAYNNNKEARHE